MPLTADVTGPQLGRHGGRRTPLLLATAGAHLLVAWALWQQDPQRDVVLEPTPLVVQLLAATSSRPSAAAPALPAPAPRLSPPPPALAPVPTLPPLAMAVAAPAPPPVAVALPTSATPSVPVAATPMPPAAVAVTAAPPAGPSANPVVGGLADTLASSASSAPARALPTSAVQYLVPPQVVYPRAARRLHETGRVLVRVWISEAGLPERLQLERSSGHALLDEAALAAVRGARFKPYIDNGLPVAGWAVVPLRFDLDR